MNDAIREKMVQVKEYIDSQVSHTNYVDDLSDQFNIPRDVLHHHFKFIFGVSPKEYILDKKMQKLIALIKNLEDEQIAFFYAHELGFRTCGGLYNFVKRRTGQTFLEFKESIRETSHL